MSDIVRYYNPKKNPQRGTFPFQPLSDITKQQWKDLTKGQRASVDASGFWQETPPPPAAKSTKDDQTFTVADEKAPAVVPESEAVNG